MIIQYFSVFIFILINILGLPLNASYEPDVEICRLNEADEIIIENLYLKIVSGNNVFSYKSWHSLAAHYRSAPWKVYYIKNKKIFFLEGIAWARYFSNISLKQDVIVAQIYDFIGFFYLLLGLYSLSAFCYQNSCFFYDKAGPTHFGHAKLMCEAALFELQKRLDSMNMFYLNINTKMDVSNLKTEADSDMYELMCKLWHAKEYFTL